MRLERSTKRTIVKEGEKMYGAEQVVTMIGGLNSISTFHRWRKYAEELCRATFDQKVIRAGHTNYTKIYQFSDDDVKKFQQVAVLSEQGKPIKSAITQVFIPKPTAQEEENKMLLELLKKASEDNNEQLQALNGCIADLRYQMIQLGQENNHLRVRLETVEKQKLDKPFYRKKT